MGKKLILHILKGLPGSGKTTRAKELVKEKNYKRVNKDSLRIMIDNSRFSKKNEKTINKVKLSIIRDCLSSGENVVVDDTNFNEAGLIILKELAEELGATYVEEFIDLPMNECIRRDSGRLVGRVGKQVIVDMWERYLKKPPVFNDKNLNAVIFDIDGTLAKMNGRSPYDYYKVDTDLINTNVAEVLNMYKKEGYKILVFTGRESSCETETKKWLAVAGIHYDEFKMRNSGDIRNDTIVKQEFLDEFKHKYNIKTAFDDRDGVVDMWRANGITCFQVGYGNF